MNRFAIIFMLLMILCSFVISAKAQQQNRISLFPVWNAQGKEGFIDLYGKVIIEPVRGEVTAFSEGLAAVNVNGKWGFIDAAGKLVIKPQFHAAFSFSDGVAAVYEAGEPPRKCGYINGTGQFVIKPQSAFSCRAFNEGFAVVDVYNEQAGESLSGYINKKGEIAIGGSFALAENFSEGLARVDDFNNTYFINKEGERVIDLSRYGGTDTLSDEYDPAGSFSEGLAEVGIKIYSRYGYARYGFVNKKGKVVFELPEEFTVEGMFRKGRALVLRRTTQKVKVRLADGEIIKMNVEVAVYGYIDRTGKLIIKPRFSDAMDFSDGLAVVEIGKSNPSNRRDLAGSAVESAFNEADRKAWACIDRAGRVVIKKCGAPLSQDEIKQKFSGYGEGFGQGFVNGLFFNEIVLGDENQTQKVFGYMNKQGKYVWLTPEAKKVLSAVWLKENFIGPTLSSNK